MKTMNKEEMKKIMAEHLLDMGLDEQELLQRCERGEKGRRDFLVHVRLSLYQYCLIKDNPSKKIRNAIRLCYGLDLGEQDEE